MATRVRLACEPTIVIVPLDRLLPIRKVSPATKKTTKYKCIEASIRELGVIEPLVVYPQRKDRAQFLILDGHIRHAILKNLGQIGAKCLISTDDEAFTYNHKVSRLGAIQEHFMIRKAIKSGVSEEKIARTLCIDVSKIKQKRDLLDGICDEAVALLRDNQYVPAPTIRELRKVKPMRQITIAELMNASHTFSLGYVKCLVAGSKPEEFVEPDADRAIEGLTIEDIDRMEQEIQTLGKEFKIIEETHGANTLSLVVIVGYLKRLLDNARIVRYLSSKHRDLLTEFQKIVEARPLGDEDLQLG